MSAEPITLKPEDQPDPHAAGVALMELLRCADAGALALRKLVMNWYSDPARSQRRALDEAVELAVTTARAIEAGEALMRARRSAGEFSHAYTEEARP